MQFAKSVRTPTYLYIFIEMLLLVGDAGMYKYYFGFVLHACSRSWLDNANQMPVLILLVML